MTVCAASLEYHKSKSRISPEHVSRPTERRRAQNRKFRANEHRTAEHIKTSHRLTPLKRGMPHRTSTVSMSFHGNRPVLTNGSARRERNSSSSPTLPKETCTKHSSDDAGYHIFGITYDSPAVCDQSTMSISMPFFATTPFQHCEKLSNSCSSVGLPSDYPLHRKCSSRSVAIQEELEDFELFSDDLETRRTSPNDSFAYPPERAAGEFRSLPPESPKRRNAPISDTHFSPHQSHQGSDFRSLQSTVDKKTETPEFLRIPRGHRHRPERNQAMGAKEFHRAILTDLFDDVSVGEFQY
jgi:hypothetical protein